MAKILPLKADHVGSFLRTEAIKEARKQFKGNEISEHELKIVEDKEIEAVVKDQINAGLKAITDGEFRRSWFMHDFYWGLSGVEYVTREGGVQFVGTSTSSDSFGVADKIEYKGHDMVDHFTFLNEMVKKHGDGSQVAKVPLPSPSQFLFRIPTDKENDVYPSFKAMFDDLAIAYNKAIHDFYDAGCRYIQLDDTVLPALEDESLLGFAKAQSGLETEEFVEVLIDTINKSVEGIPEDMVIATHMCKGNFKSTYMNEGSYGYVSRYFDRLPFDVYFLEYDDERSGGFEPLSRLQDKNVEVVLGLVTSKHGELEDKEQIKARINEATQYLPLEKLALSPQCGFASTEEGNILTEEEQWDKVKHVIEITEEVFN